MHYACWYDTPLDITIQLIKLSSWQTVNKKTGCDTALDLAAQYSTSTAIYLSWLGAECREENRKYKEVTLQTWIEADCQEEAQYWAVAANDVR